MASEGRKTVVAYVLLYGLFTLGASLIWAINTIFLIRVGALSLFLVMIVNAVYTLAQMFFEVPTGVVADTLGRRVSIVGSMLVLAFATALYVLVPRLGLGVVGFCIASALLGLGYTMQTGALDAWLVDAMDAAGWSEPKDRIFAWGQMAASAGMLVGSLLGGVLGQFDLTWPYLLRSALLLVCFVVALALVHDGGFNPRPLHLSTIGAETRRVLMAGVRYGWHNRVVRPLLLASGVSGVFFFFGFYAWQPYVLRLVGRDYVWLLGVVQAGSSAAGIAGNLLVGRLALTRDGGSRARLLASATAANALLIFGIGLTGLVWREPGVTPATVAIVLWLAWGVLYGITVPVRMSYLNAHVPSSERATVLSVDAFFLDAGSAVGQPSLGWIADSISMSAAWLLGGVFVAAAVPFYRRSANAAEQRQ